MRKNYLIIFLLLLSVGCGIKVPIGHNPVLKNSNPVKIALFMDGTTNNERSYTNVFKLFNLVTLQDNPNINAAYQRGVGNGGDFIGIMTGSGVKREVCDAYLYLAENYNHQRKDEIYLFGFSRGAYTSRMLAGLIYVAGIVEVQNLPKKKRLKYVEKIYDAHKSKKSIDERRQDVFEVTHATTNPEDYKIEFMGLWDTVAALGIPDYDEDDYEQKDKFIDQLCNVKKAVHAMSLNDNRSTVFTPVLLTNKRLISNCSMVEMSDVVNEVWFFGAHSDVGGGAKNTDISGVSLNWMIMELEGYELVPESAKVYEDRFGKTNDPRKGFLKLFYPNSDRKLSFLVSGSGYKKEKLKIHKSVLDRLEFTLQNYEINLIKIFGECFQKNESGGYDYSVDSECFEVVN